MSPIEYTYAARPEANGWVVIEFIPHKVSKEVRIIRQTKTKKEAEDLALEDMRNAPFGWALNPAAHGIWEPIETHVKIMGRTKTKEEAEALAHQYQEAHFASVKEMHARCTQAGDYL